MEKTWHEYFETLLPDIIDELSSYVHIESPTNDKKAVDRLGDVIYERFKGIGCDMSRLSQTTVGDFIRAKWGEEEEQILVIGHFDTVKPVGTIVKQPWRVDKDKIYGPGIFDMKAGIVFSYFALKTLIEKNIGSNKSLVFLWNTDEEIGSQFSSKIIEEEAKRSTAVLVIEPSYGNGAVKTSRKGGGEFKISSYGRSAHSGNDYEKGINAIEELAYQLLKVQSFTDYVSGTTVSVGIIQGGTAVNVVPDYAEARIDVRAKSVAEAKKLTEKIYALTPILEGAQIHIEGNFHKLPMERTEGTERLFLHAHQIARKEGFTLEEASVGGMSDGNTTSAMGIATLDGLGAVGDGAHAIHEHIVTDEIPYRIALLMRLFSTI